jgi:hypothetical protein
MQSWAADGITMSAAMVDACANSTHLQNVVTIAQATKFNVANYDQALGAIKAVIDNDYAGVPPFKHAVVHYYGGANGYTSGGYDSFEDQFDLVSTEAFPYIPSGGLSPMPMWQTETGISNEQCTNDQQRDYYVNVALRNLFNPQVVGTCFYEFLDEPGLTGHEDTMGCYVDGDTPKEAGQFFKDWLGAADGGETALFAKGNASDANVLITSEGSGLYTVVVSKQASSSFELIVPGGATVSSSTTTMTFSSTGTSGRDHYTGTLNNLYDLMTVQV